MAKPLNTMHPILMVDDEKDVLESYKETLYSSGIKNCILVNDSRDVYGILEKEKISILLLDLIMPHLSGQEILAQTVKERPEIPVIVITGSTQIDTAVECMKCGAFDYMVKPVEKSRLLSGVKNALELRSLQNEVSILKEHVLRADLKNPASFSHIITRNKKMNSMFKYIEAIAKSPCPVLITGESGVGKELIAKAVHIASSREGQFVAINVGGLDDTMFSDTLFGHKRGAFTGANENRQGLIVKATDGTLFLDEIGELEDISQVKLLRLLQESEYYTLGSDIARSTNTRLIAATNRDMRRGPPTDRFRRDLYYRLSTHHIHIPPLRERLDDLPFLTSHFVKNASEILGKTKPAIPAKLSVLLSSYAFPGNIRELQSMMLDAVSVCESYTLTLSFFEDYLNRKRGNNGSFKKIPEEDENRFFYSGSFPTLDELEEYFIQEAMKMSDGNQSIAAQMLGISQSTLSKRFKRRSKR